MIFQYISDIQLINAYSDESTDRLSYLLSAVSHHTETIYYNLDNNQQINILDSACTKLQERLTVLMYYADLSENNYLNHKKLPDYRDEIKKNIHHHFHGSKYKDT